MAKKRARWALVLIGVLTAAGGLADNRVGGSAAQQVAVFAIACTCFVVAGAVALWGNARSGLPLRMADARGRPRLLGDVGLGELGVHWSRSKAGGYGTYVGRDADGGLDEAVSSGQAVIAVAGASLAGRTRTLAEAARRHLAGSWLVWFDYGPQARLADLVDEARRLAHGGPVVLWLENVDVGLLSQLSAQLCGELPPGFCLLMTLDVNLMDAGILPGAAAEVLNAPNACVRLGLITPSERERLMEQPEFAQIAAAHEDEPILMGRLMVSLDRVSDSLQTSDEDAVCRVAILHAAVDWQRAAVPEPLTRKVIRKLYVDGYWRQLADRNSAAIASLTRFNHAIKSLMTPAGQGGLRLLEEAYSGSFVHLRPHPLLAVIADGPQRPPGWAISEILWKYLEEILNDPQRLTVGLTAYARRDYRHARRMLEPLDPASIPAEVAYVLAVDAHKAKVAGAARRWYTRAIMGGSPDTAAGAMINLGELEEQEGNTEDARAWWNKAAEANHPEVTPNAMFNLANLEADLGNAEDARGWYGKVLASGDPDKAPKAMLGLGHLEEKLGRVRRAREWLTKASKTGHLDVAPAAMCDLGFLEARQGNVRKARAWYAKTIDSGHSDQAPKAMLQLGFLDYGEGRIGPAREWWTEAARSSHVIVGPEAMYNLGKLEEVLGRLEDAQDWYEKVIASGNTDVGPQAMTNLGNIKRQLGHVDEARGLFLTAITTGHRIAAPVAMVNLGVLEDMQGRVYEARNWWMKAVGAGYPDAAMDAMYNLGSMEQRLGHVDEARSWYTKVIDSGRSDLAARARGQLDGLKRQKGYMQRADYFTKYSQPHIGADHEQEIAAGDSGDNTQDESLL